MCDKRRTAWQASFEAMARELVGEESLTGLELFRLVKMVAHRFEAMVETGLQDSDLTGPRLFLLIRLLAAEKLGGESGISPTELSHHQRVSKNTISALLRGLEEQGYIERRIDPEDKRAFRISLTDTGREVVQRHAKVHLAEMNRIADGLTPEERAQLLSLLRKLLQTLSQNGHPACI